MNEELLTEGELWDRVMSDMSPMLMQMRSKKSLIAG